MRKRGRTWTRARLDSHLRTPNTRGVTHTYTRTHARTHTHTHTHFHTNTLRNRHAHTYTHTHTHTHTHRLHLASKGQRAPCPPPCASHMTLEHEILPPTHHYGVFHGDFHLIFISISVYSIFMIIVI
ncbi:hypothetical protein SKAU_G00189800 [Synaphobranchus kaupii]|uniref:Uncharacterized protein n=1 Tax=Synaphobranchus kaupii TaxID=118154 RepID=A0A9Q1IWR9_SYNKA|nr:hypothetical protein SKAU_G00189800 [Synaphobranchus kaupii]